MFGLPAWASVLVAGGVLVAITVFAFRGSRARLVAFFTMAPLLALAAVIVAIGTQPQVQASHAQAEPTIFGDGSHEAGSSHAAQTAPGHAGPGHAAAPTADARPAGPTLKDVGARLRAVDGLTWPDTGTVYTTSTLWNRIDGGAELYKKAGMKQAIFATAQSGDSDIEIQLFDMSTAAKAGALYDGTDRDDESKPLFPKAEEAAAGDKAAEGDGPRAVLWRGGGEVLVGAIYGRVILSTAADDPALAKIPEAILRALAGNGASASTPTPEAPMEKPVETAAEPSGDDPPAPEAPAVETPAKILEVGDHLVTFYGIKSARREPVDGGSVRVAEFKNQYAAAAWAATVCEEDDTADGAFGCDGSKQAVRVRGAIVVWASGEWSNDGDAKGHAERASSGLSGGPPPGLDALLGATEIRAQVAGWNGRTTLGGVLVGDFDDETEVFVAKPANANEAFDALVKSFEKSEQLPGVVAGADEYQGEVLVSRSGDFIVGVAGAETRDKGLARLRQSTAALQSVKPGHP